MVTHPFLDRPVPADCKLTIDEFMNQWNGKRYEGGMPHVQNMPAKPQPVGQEYKTIADAAINIILQLDLAQDKDAAAQEFDENGNMISGMLRLSKPWFGSGRTVYADSYFGLPASASAMFKVGLFSMQHVKKRRYFPKNIPADILDSLPEELGSHVSRTSFDPSTGCRVLLVAQRDKKPQCIIATRGTTIASSEVTRVHYRGGVRISETFKPL
ncbi:hypothetical protein BGX28_006647 [Mortierella sp. GBA30]|nr:hypothetical protein BGX28_006647 [Mortierella sp. GBA30]